MRLHLEKRVTAEIQQASFLMMYKPEYLYTKIYTSTQSKWEDTVINKEHIHSQKDQYRVYFSYLQNLLSWLTQNGYWNCFPDKIADVYQLSLCAYAPSQLETSGKKRLLQSNIESIEYPYVVLENSFTGNTSDVILFFAEVCKCQFLFIIVCEKYIVHISGLTQAIGNNFPTNYMQKNNLRIKFCGVFFC